MAFSLRSKTAVFIDGANLHGTCRELNLELDFSKVIPYLQTNYDVVRALYYTAIYEDEYGRKVLQPLVDWLNTNGYLVKSKVAKAFLSDKGMRIKGNMDIEIAVDVMRMIRRIDHLFLFSGDGDFRYLVEAVQNEGVRVTVVSSMEINSRHQDYQKFPVCSIDLRRQADEFIELSELRREFSRER